MSITDEMKEAFQEIDKKFWDTINWERRIYKKQHTIEERTDYDSGSAEKDGSN